MKRPNITPGDWRLVTRNLNGEDLSKSEFPYGVEAPCLYASAVEPVVDVWASPPTNAKCLDRHKSNCVAIASLPKLLSVLELALECMPTVIVKSDGQGYREYLHDHVKAALTAAGYEF